MRHVARIAALIILAAATAEAQELAGTFDQLRVLVKPGDTLTVIDGSGQRVEGRVSSLSSSALDLTVSGRPRQFLSTDINTIEKRGPDSLKNGALIGLAIGGGIGAAGMIALAGTADNPAALMAVGALVYGGIGAGIGTGFDALIEDRRVIYARSGSAGARFTVAPMLRGSRKGVRLHRAVAAAKSGRGPDDRRPACGPLLQEAGLCRHARAIGTLPLRPVSGTENGEAEQQRGGECNGWRSHTTL